MVYIKHKRGREKCVKGHKGKTTPLNDQEAAVATCQLSNSSPSWAEEGQIFFLKDLLENAFGIKNNMSESTRYLLKTEQSLSFVHRMVALQTGSELVCSSGVCFGIHVHSHSTFQQVQQMQLVVTDIHPAFNFEDFWGYLKYKEVA